MKIQTLGTLARLELRSPDFTWLNVVKLWLVMTSSLTLAGYHVQEQVRRKPQQFATLARKNFSGNFSTLCQEKFG